ncbi:spermidine/putrescine ABC transporter substrate-binding protein [Ramlibacter tataouinensis]|uniref:Spermidine/putrescine ABC transporter substrate-binding protein n=2 Tax=Ramlibacter tataouinensis TaxID=94132 RepID=A0A127JZS8_9BURK|nr:spermidine/putrescine ABC transporter substrate-binding protein [Ramlibacter tataouinensis]
MEDDAPPGPLFRWGQLAMAMVCMATIANLQYGWTLFVDPFAEQFGWSYTAIQTAFAIFVLTQTWSVPIEGYLVDRFGPRPVVLGGGLLCAIGWVMNAFVDSLPQLYVAAAITGVGAGAVYGTCVGSALKWFPYRRGLAVGLVVAAFGAGSALTVIPISSVIASRGHEAAFLYFGLAQGLIVMALALGLEDPNKLLKHLDIRRPASSRLPQSRREYTPAEALRQPVFWVMYLVFVLVAAGGLIATAQLAPMARDFKIHDVPVQLAGIVLPALTFALALDRALNGITRLFFGWVSDRIGREETMVIAFLLEAVVILSMYELGPHPLGFVLLTAALFFFWGEIYSLFPSTCADTFGSRYAAANAGLLYTAKGVASLAVPLSSMVVAATRDWHAVFLAAGVMNLVAAGLAWFVLRPKRLQLLDSQPQP